MQIENFKTDFCLTQIFKICHHLLKIHVVYLKKNVLQETCIGFSSFFLSSPDLKGLVIILCWSSATSSSEYYPQFDLLQNSMTS